MLYIRLAAATRGGTTHDDRRLILGFDDSDNSILDLHRNYYALKSRRV
mgnify:CR=1 FL=1